MDTPQVEGEESDNGGIPRRQTTQLRPLQADRPNGGPNCRNDTTGNSRHSTLSSFPAEPNAQQTGPTENTPSKV
ncbi:hypothetical protein O181_068032 [Austropuccinia psidii MF-1]|uniref:Uncharacterized protein n=1 Tax=Austropuccinia psidii MF-1 TaxID=1389203 RepID=A0A9Q3F1U1_9BASI|nr:hypothetical protein [Austropuccinia psidii MF-1]